MQFQFLNTVVVNSNSQLTCDVCYHTIIDCFCKCPVDISFLYWHVKPVKEDYWLMDGSVKANQLFKKTKSQLP